MTALQRMAQNVSRQMGWGEAGQPSPSCFPLLSTQAAIAELPYRQNHNFGRHSEPHRQDAGTDPGRYE